MKNLTDIELYQIHPENGEFHCGNENISGTLKIKLTKALLFKKITIHLNCVTEPQIKKLMQTRFFLKM